MLQFAVMLRVRSFAGPVWLWLWLVGATASARPLLLSSLSLSGGYNSNPGALAIEVRPQLSLTLGPPRALQNLQYTLAYFATVPVAAGGTTHALNHRFEYAGAFLPSKTTELTVGVGASQGQLTLLSLGAPSNLNPMEPLRGDTSCFFGASFQQRFGWAITPTWRLEETAGLSAFVPLDPVDTSSSSPCTSALSVSTLLPAAYTAQTHLGFERVWKRDAIALQAGLAYIDYRLATSPRRDQLQGDLVARWRHDFGHFFSSRLDGGVVLVGAVRGKSPLFARPTVVAALAYTRDLGDVELLYEHVVQPNLYIAQTFENDRVALRGALPIIAGARTRSTLSIAASAGYQYGRLLDVTAGPTFGTQAAHLHSLFADATLSYSPFGYLSMFLRYQLMYQLGGSDRAGVDANIVPTVTRHLAMFGLTATYPDLTAPRVYLNPSPRVDGGDRN